MIYWCCFQFYFSFSHLVLFSIKKRFDSIFLIFIEVFNFSHFFCLLVLFLTFYTLEMKEGQFGKLGILSLKKQSDEASVRSRDSIGVKAVAGIGGEENGGKADGRDTEEAGGAQLP